VTCEEAGWQVIGEVKADYPLRVILVKLSTSRDLAIFDHFSADRPQSTITLRSHPRQLYVVFTWRHLNFEKDDSILEFVRMLGCGNRNVERWTLIFGDCRTTIFVNEIRVSIRFLRKESCSFPSLNQD
jgi:hypothetical protein